MNNDGILSFLGDAGALKRIRRTGWVESGVREPESVADHSFRTALLAMTLADAEGLDTLKAVRMALLHDLVESRVGDLTPAQKEENPDWVGEEAEAITQILCGLPAEICLAYKAILDELSLGESPEAQLVHSADKLEMLLQAREYTEAGNDPAKLMRFRHVSVEGALEKELERRIKEKKTAGDAR